MMRNNLFLNRLVIITHDGKIAYDELFHKGVNIIRGRNSSGKSTISHFIFYVLGGAFKDWVKEARRCSVVYAEVELSGATITLSRRISFNKDGKANEKEPMSFFWGNYEDAIKSVSEWNQFGYNSTPERKSFSNVMFDCLGIPTVKGENNITIHQLLRLIYVDQESPTNSLFYFEQFDQTLTRETIAELLLGIYDSDLYDAKAELVEKEKKHDELKSEIRVIKKMQIDPCQLDSLYLKSRIENKQEEIGLLQAQIMDYESKSITPKSTKKEANEFEDLEVNVIIKRQIIKDLMEGISQLSFQIEDTKDFISAMDKKRLSIQTSIKTREIFDQISLEVCPECLAAISIPENPSHCKLCKNPIERNSGITKARKMEQEISFQIAESKRIIGSLERQLIEKQSKFEAETQKLKQLQKSVDHSINYVSSTTNVKIKELYVTKGFIEGEILQFETLLEQASLYQKLVDECAEIGKRMDFLKGRIESLTRKQDGIKKEVYSAIEAKGVYLLNNDLDRQTDFIDAKEFHMDYANNLAYVTDRQARYSASSSYFLKTSARFAIFLSSISIDSMRYPRFILCDNMEDKGMEEIRAKNFQRIIIKNLSDYNPDSFQVIYTTSYIPEELNNTTNCVGEFYSEKNRTLKNV